MLSVIIHYAHVRLVQRVVSQELTLPRLAASIAFMSRALGPRLFLFSTRATDISFVLKVTFHKSVKFDGGLKKLFIAIRMARA